MVYRPTYIWGAPSCTPKSMGNLNVFLNILYGKIAKCGISIIMGVPFKIDGLFHGKSHLEMDENWGYPYLRKPQMMKHVHCHVHIGVGQDLLL